MCIRDSHTPSRAPGFESSASTGSATSARRVSLHATANRRATGAAAGAQGPRRPLSPAGSVLRGEGRRPHLRAHAPVDGVGGREDLRAAVVDAVVAPGVPARGPGARPVLEEALEDGVGAGVAATPGLAHHHAVHAVGLHVVLAGRDLDDGHPLGVALPVGDLQLFADPARDAPHAPPPDAHGLAGLGDLGFPVSYTHLTLPTILRV